MEQEQFVGDDLARLIADGDEKALRQALSAMHPADIAAGVQELSDQDRSSVLSLCDAEAAAAVLLEIEPDDQLELLQGLGPERARRILREMAADDIADLLGDAGAGDVDEVLALLASDDKADVRRLLNYPEDSAGGIMTTEYVALSESMTAARAIEHLRYHAPDAETVYYLYVVDGRQRLVGVLSLRDLITAPESTRLKTVMETNVISVRATDDQEQVARVVARYDLLAVPVVDEGMRLLGIVTVDDVIDVLEEEATEDIHRMGGTLGGDDSVTIGARVKKRLPWLIILLFGSMLGASVLRSFTETLEAVVVLAYFIPVLIDMDGNVGIQSLAVTVRSLATREIDFKRIGSILWREAGVGTVLGLVCGGLVTIVAYIWQGSVFLGAVVGVSMAVTMVVAALLGTVVPLIFHRLGVDAAVASGPFITTLCDVTGLLIYFSLATWLLSVVRFM